MSNPVHLSPYQVEWKAIFAREKGSLLKTLGGESFPVEHIGSTSIPNLSAKPIIDILLGLENLNDYTLFIPRLARISYRYIPKPELHGRRFFKKATLSTGTIHLHVCEWRGREWEEKIAFRNYLRANKDIAMAYECLKRRLAEEYREERSMYTHQKAPFIQSVLEQIRKKS
ncbi:GrpB domain, predicted nucleotidyltransferase, UPF0157 family [Halobacillus karajensis]|uniref:Dephospho-CoA kinase/protein folding accessory domain-containing protein n=1 Tax=Halobacillus karajensis TaxID=195088 RepID=A0A059NVH7_9BACI|nr:GrpB family protein [Halobacillus karajensis]CDQ18584.1 dephospho-CoA kinase/protein folding accessory domain-containing protein [Halobacillus karajensis]CDQ23344.1 dephospho-CoA kinase/protein folding accessory domain-containing protein [Halobacillus karajensis]CDQ26826.1 dephospho-CoA kinase/protein folding accessory domain-containing protein [Halobacillus karajensis]SEH49567.1 GrpB domain, predicted nucleotidyltransferase, UPF0157 family [Halobacillus karajensis]